MSPVVTKPLQPEKINKMNLYVFVHLNPEINLKDENTTRFHYKKLFH